MGDWLAGGATLLVAVLLLAAGTGKVVDPDHVAAAMSRLVPDRVRGRHPLARFVVAGRVVGLVEMGLGLGLLSGAGVVGVRLAAAVLCLGFVWVVGVAVRKGAACGCFGSFSDGPAAGAELARAGLVAVLAVVALADAGRAEPADPLRGGAVFGAALLVCALLAGMALGARLLPGGGARPGPGGAGLVHWLAGLAGTVRSRRVAAGIRPGAEVVAGRARARLIDELRADPTVGEVAASLAGMGHRPRWAGAAVQRASNPAGDRMTTVTVPAGPDAALRVMVVERAAHPDRIVATADVAGAVVASRDGPPPIRAARVPERPSSPT